MKAPFSVLLASPLKVGVPVLVPEAEAAPDAAVPCEPKVLLPLPIPVVADVAVTLKELPASTVSPALFTTFTALKLARFAPSFVRV